MDRERSNTPQSMTSMDDIETTDYQHLPGFPEKSTSPNSSNGSPVSFEVNQDSMSKEPINKPLGRGKKRKKSARDVNAPKAPLTGYVRFLNEHREKVRSEKPDLPFHEITKILGMMWTQLQHDQKQLYLAEAEKDKEIYIKELEEYQQTEAYRTFLAKQESESKISKFENTFSKLKPVDLDLICSPCNKQFNTIHNKRGHMSGKKHISIIQKIDPEGESTEKLGTETFKQHEGSLDNNVVHLGVGENKLDIPIFSEEFLNYNRNRETELQKLRRTNTDYEEQNAMLTKHINNMKSAIDKLEEEANKSKEENKQLQIQLEAFRGLLTRGLSDIRLPDSDKEPMEETIDEFVVELYKLFRNPNFNDEVIAKVKGVVSTLDYPECLKKLQ